MRVAVAGKGGVGKTTIAATLARLAAREGRTVVAVDADSNPNLAVALGMAEPPPESLPPDIVSRRLDGPRLSLPVHEALATHAVEGPDGLRLVRMGEPAHAEQGCLCSSHAVVSGLLADLGTRPDWVVVCDLEASPEHLSRGTARHADVLLFVAEPYYRALEAVRRMAALASELPIRRRAVVVNKVRSAGDAEAVREFCHRHGLEHVGDIPWGDEVVDADRQAAALVDAAPASPVVAAVAELARAVTAPAR